MQHRTIAGRLYRVVDLNSGHDAPRSIVTHVHGRRPEPARESRALRNAIERLKRGEAL